jgi:hypothetical protein
MEKEQSTPNGERQPLVSAKIYIEPERMAAALRHLLPGVIRRLEREAQEKAQQGTG